MPHLDAGVLESDPDGMAFLRDVIGDGQAKSWPVPTPRHWRSYSPKRSRCQRRSKTPDDVVAPEERLASRSSISFNQSLGRVSRTIGS